MIEIIDCVQGEKEWFEARIGTPTASMFATVKAGGKGGGESKTRKKYMLQLLGEKITGQRQEGYSNHHMLRGQEMEESARMAYIFKTGNEVQQVGFVRNGDKGASPDSLIGDDGLLEIKTKLPEIQLDLLLNDKFPTEHTAQVQGQIWVCEREWCDFVSYWPGLKPYIKRVYRDDEYIKKLSEAVDQFNNELNELYLKYENISV